MIFSVSREVSSIASRLVSSGFQAYLVGGCVRDLLLNKTPKDWDIATDATPEEIQKLFSESVYENVFGTVGVKTESEDPSLRVVEVTTFRTEEKYSDKRHPDVVRFAKTIEEDLARRDFTINALALSIVEGMASEAIVDPSGGQEDLKRQLIRAVGGPSTRFQEDALRLMRAPRFAVELGFKIEDKTQQAIREHAASLRFIAKERVRDELVKILATDEAKRGIELLEELGLLRHVIPELREGIGVTQNLHHVYTVWEHNLRSLEYAAKKGYSREVRMAALLHDVAKPRAKRGEGKYATFWGHDVLGARVSAAILERLRFPREFAEKVVRLVRWHMFYYTVGEVTASSVRRLLQKVGLDLIDELIRVREADRIGSGVPKAVPYKLRHFKYMVERVRQDPIAVTMLAVRGNDVMETLGIPPGPKVGMILQALFEEVLDDPKKNTKEYLQKRIQEFGALPDAELRKLALRGKGKKEELEAARDRELKEKYWVA